jgi:F0F1-type ATP synthase membrane subunit b/b'
VCRSGGLHAGYRKKQPGDWPQYLSFTMEIAHQLGKLFLGALPTVVVVLLFYFFLRWAFFGPIQKAMAERNARIEGARAEAAAAEAGAKQELDSYHDALRKARAEIYAEQEQARQDANDNRAKLLKAMRSRAQEDVNAAKKRIAAEVATARAQVESETPALASQIARAILDKPSSLRGGSGRGSGR